MHQKLSSWMRSKYYASEAEQLNEKHSYACNDVCYEVSICFRTKWIFLWEVIKMKYTSDDNKWRQQVERFCELVMVLTFAVDSSIEILDSYVDELFWLQSALCFDSRFGHPWFRFKFMWNFRLLAKVFDCCDVLLWALMRSSGFPACFGKCHQHQLVGAAPAQRAGVGNVRWRAPEQGADGNLPQPSVSWPCYSPRKYELCKCVQL